jgi:hypothetical protein
VITPDAVEGSLAAAHPIRFVIITGLSGAGKSFAIKCFEDLGYFCVDNLPTTLIPTFAELLRPVEPGHSKDRPSGSTSAKEYLAHFDGRARRAADAVIDRSALPRSGSTRRWCGGTTRRAVVTRSAEKAMSSTGSGGAASSPLREEADRIIDDRAHGAPLKDRLIESYGGRETRAPSRCPSSRSALSTASHDADLVFDVYGSALIRTSWRISGSWMVATPRWRSSSSPTTRPARPPRPPLPAGTRALPVAALPAGGQGLSHRWPSAHGWAHSVGMERSRGIAAQRSSSTPWASSPSCAIGDLDRVRAPPPAGTPTRP